MKPVIVTNTFDKYFNNKIRDNLEGLEKERKNILFKNYILIFLIILPLIIISFFIPGLESERYYIVIFGVLLAFLINFIIFNFNSKEENYYKKLKEIFIPLLLSKYGKDFIYKPAKSLPVKLFFESGLFGDSFQKSKGRDYIRMQHPEHNCFINFSLIHTLIFHRKNCRTSRLHVFTGFRGFFFVIKRPDNFENIQILKKQFSNWNFNEDKRFLFFARQTNLELCKPPIFKSLLKADTFIKEFKLLDEVFGSD